MQNTIRRRYLLFSALLALATNMSMSTYTPYLRSLGLTELEINLLNTTFFTVCLSFDAITGAWADKWGRKLSFIVGLTLLGLGYLCYSQASSITWCIAAELMAAFGRVFANGALSSWKDGNLKVLNATTTYANEVRTRAAIQRALVGLVSSTVGYRLYLYQHSGAWLVAGLLLLITAALAHYLLCADMGQKEKSHNTLCEVLKLGSIQIRTHPGFRTVALLTGLLTFCTQAPNMQWPKFYGHLGTGTPLLGILGGSIPLFVAFGSYLAGRQYSTPRKIQKLLACTGVSLGITAALGGTYLGLAPFYLHEIFRGSVAILKENFIGREAKEEFRATIISLDSTAGHMGAIMGLVFSGVLATHLGINVTWIVSGCVLICASILIQAIKRSQ